MDLLISILLDKITEAYQTVQLAPLTHIEVSQMKWSKALDHTPYITINNTKTQS